MIYLLDVVLIINFIVAYRYFKYLISPPVLLGMGMLFASLSATINYQQWNMEETLLETVLILGGGPSLFTLFCVIFYKKHIDRRKSILSVELKDTKYLKTFLFVSLLIGIIGLILKIQYYRSYFGGSTIPELIFAFRLDQVSGDSTFTLPFYVGVLSKYTYIVAYVSSLILSLLFVFDIKDAFLKILLFAVFLLSVINAMLTGTKGAMMDIIVGLIILYIICLYSKIGSYRLPNVFYRRLIIIVMVFIFSFQGIGILLGRQIEGRGNIDMLSEYCGAQVKNFDIFMHGKDGNKKSIFLGEDSFWSLYKAANPKYVREQREFQYVKSHNLGNVYTQYYSFHKDFGYAGLIIMSLLIAIISMKVYNKVFYDMKTGNFTTLAMYIYVTMAFSLFMSFFSFRFSENIFSANFVKNVVFYMFLMWLIRKCNIINIVNKINRQHE